MAAYGFTNPIFQRLLDLMEEKGVNAKQVTEALHMSYSSFSDWKKGKASPGVEALSKMAPYFGVSLDYLITGHEYEPGDGGSWKTQSPKDGEVSNEEEPSNPMADEMLSKFNRLPAEFQASALAYLDGILTALSQRAYLSQAMPQQSSAYTALMPDSVPSIAGSAQGGQQGAETEDGEQIPA